ncbi:MAG: ATP-binding protein [Coleofasciculaceae cyanobacterium RL_1_1]|nr:ATP-binding protein [Coleofasciculaceae cyanobacterium RL_1_1]
MENRDLADAAGLSEKTVERCLSGKNVGQKTVSAIAHVLGIADRIPELNPEPTPIPESVTLPPVVELARNNLDRYHRQIPQFVGRETAVDDLDRRFATTDTIVIVGMGGLGKTELAWRWAKSQCTAGNYPGGVCWVDVAAGDPGLKIIDFCRYKLGIELADGLPTIEAQVAACWSRWQQVAPGLVLVIFDDLERDRYRDEIEPLLPPSSGLAVCRWG